MTLRIPPIQCLTTFEALARLRSIALAAEELCVTASAIGHRVRQLEQILGTKLFGRADFSLTTDGSEYLAHVREGLAVLSRFPSRMAAAGRKKLRVAVTPTFARSILIPRLRQFKEAYPEIDLALQVSIPLLDVVAEDADLMVRFGTGRYSDVERVCLASDVVTPMASPGYLRENGPFDAPEDLSGPSCCARRWSPGAPGSPRRGSTGPSRWADRPSTTSGCSATPPRRAWAWRWCG